MGSCGNYLEEGRRQKSGYSESKRKDDNERLNCNNDFISQSRMVLSYDFTKPNHTFGCGSVLIYLGYEHDLFLLLYTAIVEFERYHLRGTCESWPIALPSP